MMVFAVLLQLLPAESVVVSVVWANVLNSSTAYCPVEAALRERVRHTAFQPGRAATVPGMMSAAQIVEDMCLQLPWLSSSRWSSVIRNLEALVMSKPQLVHADQWLTSRPSASRARIVSHKSLAQPSSRASASSGPSVIQAAALTIS